MTTSQKKSQFSTEYVQKLLQAVGVQVEINHQVDNVQIEMYLPQSQQSILILTGYNLNYDRQTINGQGILLKKLLQLVTKDVILINFKELQDITNYDDKITYLQNKGIQINVDKTQVDFSAVKQLEKKESQTKQVQKKSSHDEETIEQIEVPQ